jgi:hypothetical protein
MKKHGEQFAVFEWDEEKARETSRWTDRAGSRGPERAECRQFAQINRLLKTPNDAFDGSRPLDLIDQGESDRIWSMIYFLRCGVPS